MWNVTTTVDWDRRYEGQSLAQRHATPGEELQGSGRVPKKRPSGGVRRVSSPLHNLSPARAVRRRAADGALRSSNK